MYGVVGNITKTCPSLSGKGVKKGLLHQQVDGTVATLDIQRKHGRLAVEDLTCKSSFKTLLKRNIKIICPNQHPQTLRYMLYPIHILPPYQTNRITTSSIVLFHLRHCKI